MLRRSVFMFCLLLASSPAYSSAAELRTWTDSAGQFQIEAELVSEAEGKVRLRKADGRELEIAIDKLSQEDRRYLAAASRPAEAPARDEKLVKNSIGMELVLIPAGEFMMGTPETESDRYSKEIQHRIRITKPFYLGKHEVTQAEYERVMGTNPCLLSSTGSGKDKVSGLDTRRFPVEQVSWCDAVEFCNKLSESERLAPHYTLRNIERTEGSITKADVAIAGGPGYRLPTEAEWEYACRAGTSTPFHFGASSNGSEANVHGNYPYGTTTKGPYLERTTTVGSYRANAFGLHDMHGNVYEWCQDWYAKDYYAGSPTDDPRGPSTGEYRVFRGGSWDGGAWGSRAGYRSWFTPGDRIYYIGFRLARTP